jgi:hypothetical protein
MYSWRFLWMEGKSMNKKTKWVLIGAVLLLDLQSMAALGRHMEKRGAEDRFVLSAHHCCSHPVFPQALARLRH